VYGEIIVGPRFHLRQKNEIQRLFHHTRSVTVLLHTLIL